MQQVEEVSCEELFHEIVTEFGLCCTFNLLPDVTNKSNQDPSVTWNLEDGYSGSPGAEMAKNPHLQEKPYRSWINYELRVGSCWKDLKSLLMHITLQQADSRQICSQLQVTKKVAYKKCFSQVKLFNVTNDPIFKKKKVLFQLLLFFQCCAF